MNEQDRTHGLLLMERYAAEQDAINQLLRQIYECHGTSDSEALRDMLTLCIAEIQDRQTTVQSAFRFLLDLKEKPGKE